MDLLQRTKVSPCYSKNKGTSIFYKKQRYLHFSFFFYRFFLFNIFNVCSSSNLVFIGFGQKNHLLCSYYKEPFFVKAPYLITEHNQRDFSLTTSVAQLYIHITYIYNRSYKPFHQYV